MTTIIDVTQRCATSNKRNNNPGALSLLVVHRISLSHYCRRQNENPINDYDLNGIELADRFLNLELGTGGITPYHLLVKQNGDVDQMLPLYRRGAHAIGVNWKSIGVAIVYERGTELLAQQKQALLYVFAGLIPLNSGLMCMGHSEIEGACSDPHKICPAFQWRDIEIEARGLLPNDWRTWLPAEREAWVIGHGFRLV